MIAKQIKGTSFRGVLNYLHSKEGSRNIGGNMVGKTPEILAQEFQVASQLNPKLKKMVYHASLSLPKTEAISDEQWGAIATDYLDAMGFSGSQYVIYRHTDRDHDHIHIVASRIRLTDGSTVSDSWDYRRGEEVMRTLEQKYQLSPVPNSHEQEKHAPTTGEQRQFTRTQKPGVRVRLQTLIDLATQDQPTLPTFTQRLEEQGVEVRLRRTQQQVNGISYALDGIAFSGTQLGKAYSYPGLQKYKGVQSSSIQEPESLAQTQLQQQRASYIATVAYRLWEAQKHQIKRSASGNWELSGQHYSIELDSQEQCLTVWSCRDKGAKPDSDRAKLLQVKSGSSPEPLNPISQADIERWKQISALLATVPKQQPKQQQELEL